MKDTSWYKTGTVTVLNGANTLTGNAVGSWEDNAAVGDILIVNDKAYEITLVENVAPADGRIDFEPAFADPDYTGPYAIIRSYNHVMPSDLAVRIANTLKAYQSTMNQLLNWMTGGGDGSVDHVTLSNFAGISGVRVPTLTNIAPLATSLSSTPAPFKVPQANADGKLDMNWLPVELINAVLSSGANAGTQSFSFSTQKLTKIYVTDAVAVVDINSKDSRFFDVIVNTADVDLTLNINYVNSAPGPTDLLHTGVPVNGVLEVFIRVLDLHGGLVLNWTGSPITWAPGQVASVTGVAGDINVFRLRWLNTSGAPAGVPALSTWVGEATTLLAQP